MVKIRVEHLSKVFGRNPQAALRKRKNGETKEAIFRETGHTVGVFDVSLEINEGEIFVVMGLSGSGKSTLLRCLNLLHEPTEGKIIVDGADITAYNRAELREYRQRKTAMVFQHFGLFTHRTVLRNVEYGLEVKGVPKSKRTSIARKVLATVGLEGWEDKYPHQLSGGMMQRVGLARALATDADILLMDEPFSTLDPLIRREMQLELLDLQSSLKKTIVFITHDINEAFKLGDRVAVMKDGCVVQVGSPEEILASPANDYIADFVQDVDRTKILQARHIMFKPDPLVSLKDGVHVAIKAMQSGGISSVFVVDQERRLAGIVTIDDTLQAVQENKSLRDILRQDYHTADPETYMQDLIPTATYSKYPIAVIDANRKLLGIIMRVTVLAALINRERAPESGTPLIRAAG